MPAKKTTTSTQTSALKKSLASAQVATPAGSTTKPSRGATRASSKTTSSDIQKNRNFFVALAAVIAAGLIAAAAGFSTFNRSTAAVIDSTQSPVMFLHSSAAPKVGSKLAVTIYENSGSNPVNAVQSALLYPADKLQFVSTGPSVAFPQDAATDSATPGLVRIARSVGSNGHVVKGSQSVAVIEFTVLPRAGSLVDLRFDKPASLIVRSTDNQNVLQQAIPARLRVE